MGNLFYDEPRGTVARPQGIHVGCKVRRVTEWQTGWWSGICHEHDMMPDRVMTVTAVGHSSITLAEFTDAALQHFAPSRFEVVDNG